MAPSPNIFHSSKSGCHYSRTLLKVEDGAKRKVSGGMLEHSLGHVLKPVQSGPRGQREVQFYQQVTAAGVEDKDR